MVLERFVTGRARSNAYLFVPEDGGAVIVDPGVGAARKLVGAIEAHGAKPEAVLLTHGHPDHVWGARELSDRYGIPVYLHPSDWCWLDDPLCGGYLPVATLAGRVLGRARRIRPGRLHDPGSRIAEFEVLHTPGHTPGGVCYLTGEVCFTGDTLFATGVGHTVYPGGQRAALRESLETLLGRLTDDVRLYPGHGPDTTAFRARHRAKEAGWTS